MFETNSQSYIPTPANSSSSESRLNLQQQASKDRIAKDRMSTYKQGEPIIRIVGLGHRAFIVTSGSVLISQNGRPMDIIEKGEYFDESIWIGAEATAFIDCQLADCSDLALPMLSS